MILRCIGCHKEPHELAEYVEMADAEGCTPEEFVKAEEGTLNPENGHFACTECYIQMGMPSWPRRWVAP